MSPDQNPPTESQVELLRTTAERKIPGPLVRSADRDRLRRLGFLVADQQQGATTGQARIWRVTTEGHRFLEENANDTAHRPADVHRWGEHPSPGR